MNLVALLRHPVFITVVLLVCISAIIVERALNDLVLDYMHPIAVFGLGVLVFAVAFMFALKRVQFPFWLILFVAIGMIVYGQYYAGGA